MKHAVTIGLVGLGVALGTFLPLFSGGFSGPQTPQFLPLESDVPGAEVQSIQVAHEDEQYTLSRTAVDEWRLFYRDATFPVSTHFQSRLEHLLQNRGVQKLSQEPAQGESSQKGVHTSVWFSLGSGERIPMRLVAYSRYLKAWYGTLRHGQHVVLSPEIEAFFSVPAMTWVDRSLTCGLRPSQIRQVEIVGEGSDRFDISRCEEVQWCARRSFPVDGAHVDELLKTLSETSFDQWTPDIPATPARLVYELQGEGGKCRLEVRRGLTERGEEFFVLREGHPGSWVLPERIQTGWFRAPALQDLYPMRDVPPAVEQIRIQRKGVQGMVLERQKEGGWSLDGQPADSTFVEGWYTLLQRVQALGYRETLQYAAGVSRGMLELKVSDNEVHSYHVREAVVVAAENRAALVVECEGHVCPFLIGAEFAKRFFPPRESFLEVTREAEE